MIRNFTASVKYYPLTKTTFLVAEISYRLLNPILFPSSINELNPHQEIRDLPSVQYLVFQIDYAWRQFSEQPRSALLPGIIDPQS